MPTYNELGQLEQSVELVLGQKLGLEILIIDDNSPDGTGELAEALAKKNPNIKVMHRKQKDGLGRAYIAGFHWALANGFDYVIQMDADGSHRAKDLQKLIEVSAENTLVIGSRWVPGGEVVNWPRYREWISRAGNSYARFAIGSKVKDITAGFRIYPTKLLASLDLDLIQAQGYGFQVEMTKACLDRNVKVIEVPITFIERESGASKMTFGIILEAYLLCTRWLIRR